MRGWTHGVLVCIAASAGALLAEAAQQAGPVRDQPQTPVRYQLAGRVLDAESGQPLRRALVQATTGNLQTDRWTRTDAAGHWVFDGVNPGAYTLSASRDGYVTMAFGQRGAFGTPGVVRVPADGRFDRLDIALPRGGVITGRITDDMGDPIARAGVQALRVRFVDGVRQLAPVTSGIVGLASGGLTLTDDRGEFRLFGLAPGTYYVSALYGANAPGESDDRFGYPETFYPGTPSIAQAHPLVVAADVPVTATFTIAPTALSLVSGRVVSATGQPVAAARVTLRAVAPGRSLQVGSLLSRVADAAGQFEIRGVPAGDYVLQVQGAELAAHRFLVSSEDVRDLMIATSTGGTVSGDFVVEEAAGALPQNAFIVRAVPMGPVAVSARGAMAGSGARGAGRGFGTGALLGRHVLRLARAPDGWWLKSVIAEGKDVTDVGVDVGSGQTLEHVQVVVTQRMASLTGTVARSDGTRVSDSSVVAFPPEDSKWGSTSRFIVADTSRDDGTFALRGLPQGEYVVVAVGLLEAGEERDPERLARWRSTGQRVNLAHAETRSMALTLTR